MSGKWGWIVLFAASFALFGGLAWILDRDPPPSAMSAELAKAWKPAGDAQIAEVLAAIVSFNKVYQDFYATGGDPRLIDAMPAAKGVKHQIFRDLGYLRDGGRILVMDEAETLPVLVESDGAEGARATVYEEWNFVYQDAATRRSVTEIKGMGHGFRYTLKRSAGRWQIESWDPLTIPRPESSKEVTP